MTKRQAIELLRDELRERNADSTYSNQFLYNELMKHAKWLIKREIMSGRIYVNNSFFQTLSCIEVIETSTIDPCCPVKTNCKIYRTKNKLPEMWIDYSGPVMKSITSVDGTTDFLYTTPSTWQNKRNDPYQKMADIKYTFFSDGYLWFPEHNPTRINIFGFYTDDITEMSDCNPKKECVRFLDTNFQIPDWVHGELFAKALESIAGITKRLPDDNEINKNPARK